MSTGYQPLASYGASSGVLVEEARFAPGVRDADLIRAARLSTTFIRPHDGFQSLLYMHAGEAARVLAFWRDQAALRRFHDETRPALISYEQQLWPESPWRTHLQEFRLGTATPHLIGPRMTADARDVVVWNPPAALLAVDIAELQEIGPLLDLWGQTAPSDAPSELLDQSGFLFFSACDFGAGRTSVYIGFQRAADLESFVSSSLHRERLADYDAVISAQRATHHAIADGRLLAWFVKQIG